MSRFVLTAQLQLQAPNNVAQVVRQIQNQLNNVQVNVQVQGVQQAQRQIQQLTRNTNNATSAAERMGRAFAVSVRRFAAFSIATRAVGLFTSTLADATQTAIDFERQLIKISQVTGKSVGKLRDLTNEITNLSTSLGVSSGDLLEVTTVLAQAGLSADDTKKALNSLAKAALAPNFDSISETAEGAIAILAQFGQGVEALESQLGSINAVAGAFAVEASDLIDVIRRTGGVFKSSGGDLNELLALFTSVRATTRESAESIGTGLRTIFTRIQRPKTIEFLKQFGVELVDLEGKFVGPFEAVRRLSGALAGLGEGDITFIRIAEELGGFRQIGKVLPLLQQFSVAQEALNVANKSGNSLTQDAITAQQALAVRITKVKEEFLALIRSVTETSTFQIMANTALTLASALIKVADAVKPLLPLLAALTAVRLVKGIGGFLGGIGGGLTSGRTFNKGGKVYKFARGGMVPGTGNRDTVPAMLQPGEFVIRKSSVNKLGASNLAAMNENRFAGGGLVVKQTLSDQYAGLFAKPRGEDQGGKPVSIALSGKSGGKEILAAVGSPRSYFIGRSDESTFEADAENRLISAISDISQQLGGPLAPTGSLRSELVSSIGVKDIAGKIFEGVTRTIAGSFGGTSQATFDVPRGTVNNTSALYELFNSGNLMPNIDYDAKLSENRSNRASLLKKAINANLIGPDIELASFRNSATTEALTKYPKGEQKNNVLIQRRSELQTAISKASSLIQDKEVEKLIVDRLSKQLQLITQNLPSSVSLSKQPIKRSSGGGVGTDTVPALLTPGEFVINRNAAKSIGYGSLNRMNKIGKYAKGGVVHRFSNGGAAPAYSGSGPVMSAAGGDYIPFDTLSRQARNLSNAQQALIKTTQTSNTTTQQASQAQQQQAKSATDVVTQNKMFVASMATSLIQGFLPAVDENSGALLRVTHSLLGLSTTVLATAAALEAFNIQLNIQNISSVFDLLSGKGGSIAKSVGQFAGQKLGGTRIGGMVAKFGGMGGTMGQKAVETAITRSVTAIGGIVGPLVGATAAFFAIQTAGNSLVEAFMNYEGRIKKAIEGGNVEQARQIATEQQQSRSAVNFTGGAVSGAIVGTLLTPILGPLGPVLGSVVGGLIGDALSDLPEYAGQVAATQASLIGSQKALSKASEDATKALAEFEKGNISATQLLQSTSAATAAVAKSRAEADKLTRTGEANRDTEASGTLRNVLTLGGLLGESSGERDARITAEQQKATKEVNKQEEQAIQIAQPALSALSKQIAMTGGSFDDLMSRIRSTDPNLYNILIRQGTNELNKSFQNVAKEVARTKAALEATNLGLRTAQATSTAMSASMDRFAAGLEVGGNTFVANSEFLSEAMSSAAQAMNPSDIKSAIDDVSKNLLEMGVSPKFVQKFEGNTNALIQAQQNYGKAFDNIIAESKAMGKIFSADELKDKFAEQLGSMMGPDVSDEAKANLKAIIGGIELNPDEINEIMSGNYKAFGDKLTEAGQKQIAEIIKIAQERQKAEQVLINLTKTRIDAERNLVQAQQDALDLYLEGREIQAGAGGRAVSAAERRSVILGKANAQGDRSGLASLRTGSAAELRRRNTELVVGASRFEQRSRTEGGLQGVGGVEAAEGQKDLQQAYKQQVDTIRSLIKLEQEELKIIQEKNRLEKESLESLIKGDIDKFFEQQAAVGATAAVATGNQDIMNQFGATALAGAFENLQRQQAAGVQESFGMQIGGPGGLLERAAGAALGARGVTDFNATRTLAGTTPEEEARKATIRELGGVLSETGQAGVDMAQMQLNTAEINVANANIKLSEIEERGRLAAQGLYRGGTVYASNGIFVPRGTDTVPAMLTPGEFVVNRSAVNRGNNLQILKAINSGANATGLARGGSVGYYSDGGKVQYLQNGGTATGQSVSIDPTLVSDLINGLNNFNVNLTKNIRDLQNTKFQIKLDTTNVNVNLMGGTFLSSLAAQIKKEILTEVGNKIKNYKVGEGGRLQDNRGVI